MGISCIQYICQCSYQSWPKQSAFEEAVRSEQSIVLRCAPLCACQANISLYCLNYQNSLFFIFFVIMFWCIIVMLLFSIWTLAIQEEKLKMIAG